MRASPSILAPALCCAALAAQHPVRTRSLPKAFAGWDAPEGNWLPLGRTRGFLQTWYHGSNLVPGPIREIGWRIDAGAVAPRFQHRLEIVLADTAKTFSTLDRVFANNLGASPAVFLKLRQLDFPAVARPRDPERPSLWIKGDRPFVFRGPHLIVQVDIRSRSRFAFVSDYLADSYFEDRGPIHGRTGKSCGKGRLTATVEGGSWTLALAGLAPRDAGVFLIGFENLTIGSLRLPLDLTPFGMKGCTLEIDTVLIRASAAAADGIARFRLPLPPSTRTPVVLHAQGAEIDRTKAAGLATSNAVHSILSVKNLSTYLYNWSRDGKIAEFGPFTTNTGAVLLWKR